MVKQKLDNLLNKLQKSICTQEVIFGGKLLQIIIHMLKEIWKSHKDFHRLRIVCAFKVKSVFTLPTEEASLGCFDIL